MSKLVLTVLTSLILILLVVAIIFSGVSISKYNNIACRNDADAVNAKTNVQVSLILQCIAIFFLVFMIIYVYFWRQRRIRGGKEYELSGDSPGKEYDPDM